MTTETISGMELKRLIEIRRREFFDFLLSICTISVQPQSPEQLYEWLEIYGWDPDLYSGGPYRDRVYDLRWLSEFFEKGLHKPGGLRSLWLSFSDFYRLPTKSTIRGKVE